MRRKIIVGILFSLAWVFLQGVDISYAAGPTLVSTHITTPTVWKKENSPYILKDSYPGLLYGILHVKSSLIIEPGVVVKFSPDSLSHINIYPGGSLTAIGTANEKIVFTSPRDDSFGGDTNGDGGATVPSPGDWYAIGVNGTATFENVIVRYGSNSPGTGNIGVNPSASAVLILRNSTIQYGKYAGIALNKAYNITIENNIISDNGTGIRVEGHEYGKVMKASHNVITNNMYGAWVNGIIWWWNFSPLDLRDNWWGDQSGPYYKSSVTYGVPYSSQQNLGGKGNKVGDGVLFNPWLGKDPFALDPGCTENCFSNVMFLPGLEASRLYESDNGSEVKLWEPTEDADAEKLYLDENGRSVRSGIYTKDVLDNAYVPIKGNVYKSFLADLEKWKTEDKIINDYTSIPYDWRFSVKDIVNSGSKNGDHISYGAPLSSPYIIKELRRLAESSRTGKVTIIAHSNGGLVTKALTDKLGAEAVGLIDRIVLVAVPQSGTPQAIGALLHGFDQGLPVNWMPTALSLHVARKLAQNMSSAYGLLPSGAYFSGWGSEVLSPVITFEEGEATQSFIAQYGEKINDFSELKEFLKDGEGKVSPDSSDLESPSVINETLFQENETIHDTLLDHWSPPSGVSVYQIAGFGEDTVGSVRYWTGMECTNRSIIGRCLSFAPKLEYTPELIVDGDGTVVAPSALALSNGIPGVSRWWVDLNKYDTFSNLEREHADILEVPQLRDFIKENILTQTSSNLPSFISGSEPPTFSEKRLRYFLHSPLALSVRDEDGHEISASASDIPGAEYQRFGEVQYISLPAAIRHTLLLDGEAEGSFTLEVQELEDENVSVEAIFSGMPTSSDTEVVMNFPDGTISNASPLHVDYDGDGNDDFSLQARIGEMVLPDTIAPTTNISLSGTEGANDWYTSDVGVAFSATDNENGSGVEQTTYSFDDGITWKVYSEPFAITEEGIHTLTYFSTDRQGNKEEVQERTIKIDMSAPEISFSFDSVTKKFTTIGSDMISSVTIDASDSNIKAVDEAGYVTTASFTKNEAGKQIKFEMQSLSYDGISVNIPVNALHYEWSLEKNGSVKMLNELAVVDSLQVNAHYLAKDNETKIRREENGISTNEKKSGLNVLRLVTNKGNIKIIY